MMHPDTPRIPIKFRPHVTYPPDLNDAYEAWGASCGPCSIASILGTTLYEIHDYLEGIDARGYMNILHVKAALNAIPGIRHWGVGETLPKLGLAFIQWSGHDHKPVRVQYQFTHWIAVEADRVFEVNAPELTTWPEWQRVMPRMMQEEGNGDGGFRIRSGIEVRLR
jgi:hypothetical protein